MKASIESVLSQTFQDFELIIIDDGSTDSSREIIEGYRDRPRVGIIYQQNKGLNVTNNIAMRAASGKYIMRLDADDFLEPDAVEIMAGILEANPAVGLVFPDYYYVNTSGERTGEERRHNFESDVSLFDQPAHGACTMIRLSFLKSLGGYNEGFTSQDGYDLWLKFVSRHKVTNVNRPLFSYRRHDANLTLNEEKILATRKSIKENFVDQHFKTPLTAAVIPIRNTWIGKENLSLVKLGGKTLIERKVDSCLESKKLSAIVVSAADKELFDHAFDLFRNQDRVHVIERPKSFAGLNESLTNTIKHALDHLRSIGIDPKALMSVSIDYPFVSPDVYDEAINTLVLFGSDSVLSVRPDSHMYYQHTGHTLVPILNQEKFTRLEREALYKGAGGVLLTKVKGLDEGKSWMSGRISHVVVDQRNALSIATEFDLKLAQLIELEEAAT